MVGKTLEAKRCGDTASVCVGGAVRERGGVETSVCGFWFADKEWAALGGGGCFGAHDASAPAAIITTQHTTTIKPSHPCPLKLSFQLSLSLFFFFIQSLLDYNH